MLSKIAIMVPNSLQLKVKMNVRFGGKIVVTAKPGMIWIYTTCVVILSYKKRYFTRYVMYQNLAVPRDKWPVFIAISKYVYKYLKFFSILTMLLPFLVANQRWLYWTLGSNNQEKYLRHGVLTWPLSWKMAPLTSNVRRFGKLGDFSGWMTCTACMGFSA